jgi:hypothetical protein
MPQISLTYGAVFTALAAGLWFGLASFWKSLMLALAGRVSADRACHRRRSFEASRRRQLA